MANTKLKLKVGVIGYKNHAKKIINLLLKKKIKIAKIYHPKKRLLSKNYTNNLNDLLNLDCVFIICPSNYHFYYLEYLKKKKFSGYIFCEKPPVMKLGDLRKLKRYNFKKIYFNLNLRCSLLFYYISKYKKLGKLVSLNIVDSKPLIYKKNIKKNWRMNEKGTLISNNFIHYLDLVIFNNGKNFNEKKIKIVKSKVNKSLKIIDNILIQFKHGGIIFNIYLSYSNGLEKSYYLYFKNGKIEILDSIIKIYHRIKNLNEKNNFTYPILYKKAKIDSMFYKSNQKSLEYFFTIVKKKSEFKNRDFKSSIISNRVMLNILNKLK